jgi:SEL1 protein
MTATELYKSVTERGQTSHMFMEAHQAYKENDVETALIKYVFLAELGYEVAQSNVAFILDQTQSKLFSKMDSFKRALVNWNRAATQGYHIARLKLGDYYYYGKGTSVDYQQAASHYKYASEISHNPQAMFNLAFMHENGLGLRKDIHLAKRFYDMASETSIEAYLPVALALFKLNLLFFLESMFNFKSGADDLDKSGEAILSGISFLTQPHAYFGHLWDVYLMTILAGLISFMYLIRRRRNLN